MNIYVKLNEKNEDAESTAYTSHFKLLNQTCMLMICMITMYILMKNLSGMPSR